MLSSFCKRVTSYFSIKPGSFKLKSLVEVSKSGIPHNSFIYFTAYI